MKTLILTDIHANFPAFQQVLDDAGKWDRVLFLGDIANFGPNPGECVDLLRSLNPICIMGNHDYLIAGAWGKRNFFDEWSRNQLKSEQLDWIKSFKDQLLLDESLLSVHGAYNVPYDLLPGIPSEKVKIAFENNINGNESISAVLFGHYHYQLDMKIDKIDYHCIRPVGHHRDKDVRAGYSIMENGEIKHYRVEYDLEKTIYDTKRIDCLKEPFKTQWIELLQNAFSESLLEKDQNIIKGYVK